MIKVDYIHFAIIYLKKELKRVEKMINYRTSRDVIMTDNKKVIPVGDMYAKQTTLEQMIKTLEEMK
jgi:hypothetical protein